MDAGVEVGAWPSFNAAGRTAAEYIISGVSKKSWAGREGSA